jgi:malonate-semialdehyde dehydrogenase (acetylating)/methylmalonate-semialdehyde dehydrogenase
VRAIEVTEFACSLPQLAAGEVLEVSPGVECRVDRLPLGVVASIAPFNFQVIVHTACASARSSGDIP